MFSAQRARMHACPSLMGTPLPRPPTALPASVRTAAEGLRNHTTQNLTVGTDSPAGRDTTTTTIAGNPRRRCSSGPPPPATVGISLTAAKHLAAAIASSASLVALTLHTHHLSAAGIKAILHGASLARNLRSLTVCGGLTILEGRAVSEALAAFTEPGHKQQQLQQRRCVPPSLSSLSSARSNQRSSARATPPLSSRGRTPPRVTEGGLAWRWPSADPTVVTRAVSPRAAHAAGPRTPPLPLPLTPRQGRRLAPRHPSPQPPLLPPVQVVLSPLHLDEPTARVIANGCSASSRIVGAVVRLHHEGSTAARLPPPRFNDAAATGGGGGCGRAVVRDLNARLGVIAERNASHFRFATSAAAAALAAGYSGPVGVAKQTPLAPALPFPSSSAAVTPRGVPPPPPVSGPRPPRHSGDCHPRRRPYHHQQQQLLLRVQDRPRLREAAVAAAAAALPPHAGGGDRSFDPLHRQRTPSPRRPTGPSTPAAFNRRSDVESSTLWHLLTPPSRRYSPPSWAPPPQQRRQQQRDSPAVAVGPPHNSSGGGGDGRPFLTAPVTSARLAAMALPRNAGRNGNARGDARSLSSCRSGATTWSMGRGGDGHSSSRSSPSSSPAPRRPLCICGCRPDQCQRRKATAGGVAAAGNPSRPPPTAAVVVSPRHYHDRGSRAVALLLERLGRRPTGPPRTPPIPAAAVAPAAVALPPAAAAAVTADDSPHIPRYIRVRSPPESPAVSAKQSAVPPPQNSSRHTAISSGKGRGEPRAAAAAAAAVVAGSAAAYDPAMSMSVPMRNNCTSAPRPREADCRDSQACRPLSVAAPSLHFARSDMGNNNASGRVAPAAAAADADVFRVWSPSDRQKPDGAATPRWVALRELPDTASNACPTAATATAAQIPSSQSPIQQQQRTAIYPRIVVGPPERHQAATPPVPPSPVSPSSLQHIRMEDILSAAELTARRLKLRAHPLLSTPPKTDGESPSPGGTRRYDPATTAAAAASAAATEPISHDNDAAVTPQGKKRPSDGGGSSPSPFASQSSSSSDGTIGGGGGITPVREYPSLEPSPRGHDQEPTPRIVTGGNSGGSRSHSCNRCSGTSTAVTPRGAPRAPLVAPPSAATNSPRFFHKPTARTPTAAAPTRNTTPSVHGTAALADNDDDADNDDSFYIVSARAMRHLDECAAALQCDMDDYRGRVAAEAQSLVVRVGACSRTFAAQASARITSLRESFAQVRLSPRTPRA